MKPKNLRLAVDILLLTEPFKASASYTYGVGGFLLAGREIHMMH